MLAPAHVSIIKCVSFHGIAAMGLIRRVSAKAKLPAPGHLTVCSQENSQDVSFFTQGMAMTNVDVSRLEISTVTERPLLRRVGNKHCNGTIAVASCGCGDAATGFFSASARSLSLVALGLHVACFVAIEALSPIVAFYFLGRFVSHIVGLVFALDVLAFAFAFAFAFALFGVAFALRIRSELHWHWLTVSVLLCSGDLEKIPLASDSSL